VTRGVTQQGIALSEPEKPEALAESLELRFSR